MNLPKHVAIIMDGNSRWAKANSLTQNEGHRKGAETAFKILRRACEIGVKNLSLFAFSSENWQRPDEEVKSLMNLLAEFLHKEINKIIDLNIKLEFVGALSKLDAETKNILKKAEKSTSSNTGINLYVMISYGGRQEIVDAAKEIMLKNININDINNDTFSNFFYSPNMPNVDLLIRTGDRYRISNFLLWQSAYAELYFSKKMWPEFSEDDFENSLKDFQIRTRSFGLRNE